MFTDESLKTDIAAMARTTTTCQSFGQLVATAFQRIRQGLAWMLGLCLLLCSSLALADPVWTAGGSLTAARSSHTATLLPNGVVLIAGGLGDGTYLASAERYDPATSTWSAADTLTTARSYHTATLLPNGKVLVAGGYNDGSYLASTELYDPANDTWSAAQALTTTRGEHTATLLPNGKVLIAGGYNGSYLASAQL